MRQLLTIIFLLGMTFAHAEPLKIGAIPFYPPFEIQGDKEGQLSGFDIDLIMAICKEIDQECMIQPTVFKDIIPKLLTNEINLAASAIIITKEREQFMLFSLPYLASYLQFMTLKSNPLQDLTELKGKIVATITGSVISDYLHDRYGKTITVKEYQQFPDMLDGLMNKQVDLVLIDYYAAQYWIVASGNQLKFVGEKLPFGTGYGFAAPKGNEALISQINKGLVTLEYNGEYLKIYNKYFGE
ncbi:transporter substrate-binding domain-containing protein [Legionella impletisoli]|uniref:Arginine ABC transporter substrate-binding protein n=1 Tax=Legionella impletisoli TaxID=343510 RepID=A0A917NDX9_9GAMM|nr:transporter substrate-binding domain-containing protein [Legionella impletisoli]GGI92697.1 arginine ABC transporter substrate-binding protein [Legionella impletisoli]